MKKIIATVIITLLVIFGVFLIIIYSGSVSIGQKEESSFTKWILTTTKNHSLQRQTSNLKEPPMNDSIMFRIGFDHYNEMCATCHGGPGISPDELAQGLYPKPPEFYKIKEQLSPSTTFWIIKNGLRFTAMPAFGPTHDDHKIWAITDFLLNKLPHMSPSEYKQWQYEFNHLQF